MQCRLGWFCYCQCVDKEEAKNRRRWRHYAAVETEASSIIHCYWRHNINSEPFRDRFLLKKSLVVLSGKISSLLSVNGHRIMLSYKTLNVINSWVCYLQQYVQVHVDRQSLLLLAEGPILIQANAIFVHCVVHIWAYCWQKPTWWCRLISLVSGRNWLWKPERVGNTENVWVCCWCVSAVKSEELVIRPRLAPLSTSHDSSWLLDP